MDLLVNMVNKDKSKAERVWRSTVSSAVRLHMHFFFFKKFFGPAAWHVGY